MGSSSSRTRSPISNKCRFPIYRQTCQKSPIVSNITPAHVRIHPALKHAPGASYMSQLLSRRALVGAVAALVALSFTPASPSQVPGDTPVVPAVPVLPVVPTAPSVDISGRWRGTWDDLGTGHH